MKPRRFGPAVGAALESGLHCSPDWAVAPTAVGLRESIAHGLGVHGAGDGAPTKCLRARPRAQDGRLLGCGSGGPAQPWRSGTSQAEASAVTRAWDTEDTWWRLVH